MPRRSRAATHAIGATLYHGLACPDSHTRCGLPVTAYRRCANAYRPQDVTCRRCLSWVRRRASLRRTSNA